MTLNEIRSSGYWIVGGSSSDASYVVKCVKCRKLRGMVEEQKMADLPPDPSFTFSAVGLLRPLDNQGRKERNEKIWRLVYLYGVKGGASGEC